MPATFRILAATDGSSSARAAIATTLEFPWPPRSRARAVVALGRNWPAMGPALRTATVRSLYQEADPARRLLARRWPDADVVAIHDSPVAAILAEARRYRADAIALGWRGHGAFHRLIAGSVSRGIVARAGRPVLVVRTTAKRVRRLVVGFDGSAGALRAVRFLARLEPQRGSVAFVVTVTEPLWIPRAAGRLSSTTRDSLRRDAVKVNRMRATRAKMHADSAGSILRRAGWVTRTEIRVGAALEALLEASADLEGDILVVGRRAAGSRRAPPGSVSVGALDHSSIPVLIVP